VIGPFIYENLLFYVVWRHSIPMCPWGTTFKKSSSCKENIHGAMISPIQEIGGNKKWKGGRE